jgi:hypothetical protein
MGRFSENLIYSKNPPLSPFPKGGSLWFYALFIKLSFYFFPKSSLIQTRFFLKFLSKLKMEHIARQIPHLLHLLVSAYTLLSFSETLIAPAGQLTIQKGEAQNL